MKSQFGGGVWPVVQRELRAAARWPLGRWLRVGGALVGIAAFWFSSDVPFNELGPELFDRVHTLLLYLICAIVPALTADCLARERREGTLGLLFMTPLTASGIVLGKTLAQVLRALTVWLAVVPVLTIPFLTGGVTWADVISFLVIELCVGSLCLAAGILATSLTDNRAIAFILAFLFMGAFVAGSSHYQDWRMQRYARTRIWRAVRPGPASANVFVTISSSVTLPNGSIVYPTGSAMWITPRGVAVTSRHPPARILAADFIVSFIKLFAALRFAGWRVERSWQDKIPTARQQHWVRRYCTPLFGRRFARSMRRTLEWNPIAWLQQYSWKARLSKWGLCLLFVLLECAVIDGNDPYSLGWLVTALLLILAAAYTYAGVNGFLQEKKSGALELILVSPLSVQQIIFGRVWGLWKQFLPSVVLLLASDVAVNVMIPQSHLFYGGSWVNDDNWFWIKDLEVGAIYLTLPIIATSCALRFKSLIVGSALTVAVVFGPAAVLFFNDYLIKALNSSAPQWLRIDIRAFLEVVPSPPVVVWVMAAHASSAYFAFKFLRRSLARRNYSF